MGPNNSYPETNIDIKLNKVFFLEMKTLQENEDFRTLGKRGTVISMVQYARQMEIIGKEQEWEKGLHSVTHFQTLVPSFPLYFLNKLLY